MNLRVLGTVSRTHGLKGAFKLNITVGGDPELEKDEPVFIRLQGGPVPFFVQEYSRSSANTVILKVDDVESIEAAGKFVGCEVSLPEERFADDTSEDPADLIGYRVTDIHQGAIGKISGIMQLPQHRVLEVEKEGKQILIPYADEVVKRIDRMEKTVTVETPEGLIALYMDL